MPRQRRIFWKERRPLRASQLCSMPTPYTSKYFQSPLAINNDRSLIYVHKHYSHMIHTTGFMIWSRSDNDIFNIVEHSRMTAKKTK